MSLRDAFLDLVLGGRCAGCERPGVSVCAECWSELTGSVPFEAWPEPRPESLPPPTASARYDGVVRRVILEHKEHARYGLAKPLGLALANAVSTGLGPRRAAWLCPVPSTWATVRTRGHDPLRRLVIVAVRHLRGQGYDVRLADALRVVRRPVDQAGLSAAERSANLAGAFATRSRSAETLTGQPVLLVDDVLTTGSTLAEARRALETTGIEVSGCAVIAATARRTTPGS